MKYLISLLITLAFLPSCKKESEPDPPIIPVDTPSVYVPIYQPGDTSIGAGYAQKLTANWKAEAICRIQNSFDSNFISIVFLTYNNHWELREAFGFVFIPKNGEGKTFPLKKMIGSTLQQGFVSAEYYTYRLDGDVLEDQYVLDSLAADNQITITKMDHVNKRMECTFTATFKIVEPRRNAANPKTVKFSEGRAWAVIQE